MTSTLIGDNLILTLDAAKAVPITAVVKITATDDHEPPQKTTESFGIIIIDDTYIVDNSTTIANLTLDVNLDELKPLEVWIESISSTGLMEIRYSDKVIPV